MILGSAALIRSSSQPDVLMPLADFAQMGSLMLLRSMIHLESAMLVLDFLHLDSSLLLRCHTRLELMFLTYAQCRFGLTISALDSCLLESSVFLQSMLRVEFVVFALDPLKLDPSMSLQNLGCLDPNFLLVGMSWLGLVVLSLDFGKSESPVLPRSSCHLGFPISTLDYLNLGSSMFVRSFTRIESSLLLQMFACCGSAYLTFGMMCLALILPLLDGCHTGSFLSTRGYGCSASSLPALDFLRLESILFLQNPA